MQLKDPFPTTRGRVLDGLEGIHVIVLSTQLGGAVAKVVDIEQAKIQRLAAELLPAVRDAFADTGMLVVPTDGLDVEVWRMAARRAGHQVAKNVRTGITPDGSAVWIVDDSPLEGEHLAEVRRRAARTIEQLPRLR